MASEPQFRPELRLHRLSWLFALTSSIRQMILPLIALAFFGARDQASYVGVMMFPVVLAALFVQAVWRQWIFRYGFGPRGLVIQDGLFFRNVRQIDYSRIENVDTERGVLHRLLGVAAVSVQTSTGGKAEARISVLDLPAVQEMRERIFADGARPAESDAAADSTLLKLPVSELVRYGVINNVGLIVIAAAGGALYQLGVWNVNEMIVERVLAQSSGIVALRPWVQAAVAFFAVVGVLAATRVVSILVAVVTLFDFTLTRAGDDLRIRHGLFTRVALTVRSSRVQAVHETRSLLHRWLRRSSLSVDLTGDHGRGEGQEEGAPAKTRWIAPVCKPDEAPALIKAATPTIDLPAQPEWRPLAAGARVRLFKKTLLAMVVISTTPIVVQLGPMGVFVPMLLGPPLAWVYASFYVKHTAWALLPDALLFRRGWWMHRLSVVPRDRIQSTNVMATPLDRRAGMASLLVDTAGASLTRLVRIPYLDRATADWLSRQLYVRQGASGALPAQSTPAHL